MKCITIKILEEGGGKEMYQVKNKSQRYSPPQKKPHIHIEHDLNNTNKRNKIQSKKHEQEEEGQSAL